MGESRTSSPSKDGSTLMTALNFARATIGRACHWQVHTTPEVRAACALSVHLPIGYAGGAVRVRLDAGLLLRFYEALMGCPHEKRYTH